MIRKANVNDIDELVEIENGSFELDRFSRRTFRYLLTKANAEILVDDDDSVVRGYAIILFTTGTSLGRLYSFAVHPRWRGRGVGKALLAAAEAEALARDCVSLRVEVRKDNSGAVELYRNMGYRKFDEVDDYYEDGMSALRFEKSLAPHLRAEDVGVPYYRQTLDFTCGPSALMMAMSALDRSISMDRMHELRLWRESTSIFMTSGHGGCGPYGLLLAAFRRGFDAELVVSRNSALFVDSVRSAEKKEVIRLVQEDFLREIEREGIAVRYGTMSLQRIQEEFEKGGIPVVLISSYRIYREKFPHWVVVTGFDDRFVYVHDSYVDEDEGKSEADCLNMPILKKDFERMTRYGKAGLKATMIVKKRKSEIRVKTEPANTSCDHVCKYRPC